MPVGEVEEAKEIQADKKRGYLGSLSVDLFWPSAFKRHGSPRTSSIVQDIVSWVIEQLFKFIEVR